jgi:2-phosphoglycerate kinase
MADKPLKVYRGQWPETVVCGASGTGRTRFAYGLAARYNGHVVDTGDMLEAARAVADPAQQPDLFYQDAEDWRRPVQVESTDEQETPPLTGTAEELAAARFRAADALFPAVKAVAAKQPRLHLDGYFETPHTVITGRHALPNLAFDFVVILLETEEQIRANLEARLGPHDFLDLRARTSMLVQDELIRRAREHAQQQQHCDVVYSNARPWEDVVERTYGRMDDLWDYRTALGGMW